MLILPLLIVKFYREGAGVIQPQMIVTVTTNTGGLKDSCGDELYCMA